MNTFNFSGLQQKADQTLHNADEFVRKWQEFIAAPAGNVNLEYYDRNGNLKTVSFSNRNKLIQDFITNVNFAMSKTFYVDATNGNDNNDGSQNAPFKTIQKAIDSVPVGGQVTIILNGSNDYSQPKVYTITNDIKIYNKRIVIRANGPNHFAKITATTILESNSYNHSKSLILYNSCLSVISKSQTGFVILENPKKIDSDKGWRWHHKALIQVADGMCSVNLRGWVADHPQIVMTDQGSNIICINSRNAYAAFANINFWYLNAKLENSNCKIVDFYQGDSHVSGAIDARIYSIKDVNGNSIEFKDVISGVVYDSNTGLPKNILTATF